MSTRCDVGDALCRAPRLRLRLEPLEQRLLLDGNVTVEFFGSQVIVTGDDYSNGLEIQYDSGSLEFTGVGGTTVNGTGGTVAWPMAEVSGVYISMAGGSDYVELLDLTVDGNVRFDGGDGNDGFDVVSCRINDRLRAGFGEGEDGIEVAGSYVGNVRVDMGHGESHVLLGSSTVAGRASVRCGDGYDSVQLRSASVGGDVSVRTGTGSADVQVVSVGIGGGLGVTNREGDTGVWIVDSWIGGSVGLRTDAWDDDVEMEGTMVEGDLKIRDGGGSDEVSVEESDLGTVRITGADGQNAVSFSDVYVRRGFGVRNGDGYDDLELDGVEIDGTLRVWHGTGGSSTWYEGGSVEGGIRLGARAGYDSVGIGSVWTVGLKVGVGDGGSEVGLDNVTAYGRGVITSGAGCDDIRIDDSYFASAVKINTGDDSDEVMVETDESNGATYFYGPLSVRTGRGDDDVQFGQSGEPDAQVYTDSQVLFAGGAGYDTLGLDNLVPTVPPVIQEFEA
jgi:hypothetical protein